MSTLIPITLADIAGVPVVPVKLSALNHDPSVNVSTADPLVIDKLGALVVEPPVVPNVNVAVTSIALVNPPVPVQVKLVASDILNALRPGVLVANTILLDPNATDRVRAPLDENVEQVRVYPFNENVPAVNVKIVELPNINKSPTKVVVPPGQLIVIPPSVLLLLLVKVPVLTKLKVVLVYVPGLLKVTLITFSVPAPKVKLEIALKLSVLNQLPVVIVGVDVPLINVRFTALVILPPVVPNTNVLFADITVVNPPVPVHVKLVTVAIANTVRVAVPISEIVPEPKLIDLVTAPLELNIPVVKVKLANASVPLVRVTVLAVAKVNAAPNVVVPNVLLIVKVVKVVFPLLVIVPVPTIVAVNVVNVPPLDSVKLFKFNVVVPIVNAVVPKLRILNQLPVVIVATDEPLISVKFGALVDVPPAVWPKLKFLVTDIIAVKPPVPVHVKLVAVDIVKFPTPGAVVDNTILPVPNAILRAVEPLDKNPPLAVNVKLAKFNVPAVKVVAPPVVNVNALPNVQVPPTPLKVIDAANATALVVIV